jgi:hypothetical protein
MYCDPCRRIRLGWRSQSLAPLASSAEATDASRAKMRRARQKKNIRGLFAFAPAMLSCIARRLRYCIERTL